VSLEQFIGPVKEDVVQLYRDRIGKAEPAPDFFFPDLSDAPTNPDDALGFWYPQVDLAARHLARARLLLAEEPQQPRWAAQEWLDWHFHTGHQIAGAQRCDPRLGYRELARALEIDERAVVCFQHDALAI
jgi:hypothetical protein